MNSFALHLEKLAQAGMQSHPSSAQLYAADKTQREFDSLMQAGSPKAYATAIAGGMISGLGLPTILGLTSLGGGQLVEKTNKAKAGVYVKEALTRIYNFPADEAGMIAASMTSSNPLVTANVNARIAEARIGLADMLSRNPMPGIVDEKSRSSIIKRTEKFVDKTLTDAVNQPLSNRSFRTREEMLFARRHAAEEAAKLRNNPLQKKIKLVGALPQAKDLLAASPEFQRTMIPGFTSSETKALMGIGEHLYVKRTGKPISDTKVALKLVSKQIGNSIKAGIPLAAILGGVAVMRERSRAKEKATFSATGEPTAFGVEL